MKQAFEGICNNIERRYKETQSDASRKELEELMSECPCPDCQGRRLRKESLAVTVGEKNIYEFTTLSVEDALIWMDGLTLTEQQMLIADRILKEIRSRLGFLKSVGLGYLTLARSAGTLSGGESQRIRLATQIGSSLMGVLYILDARRGHHAGRRLPHRHRPRRRCSRRSGGGSRHSGGGDG